MSTEVGIIHESGSRQVDLYLCRFWGGAKAGACIQLTALQEDGQHGYVQLSAGDIVALMPELKAVIDDELARKKQEVEAAIAENRQLAKTIFNDMLAVAQMAISQPVFDMSSILFFGGKGIDRPTKD